MKSFLRRCYGACLTVLGAVTGTRTQAKHNASIILSCIWCGDTRHRGAYCPNRPVVDCGTDFEASDPSRPAGGPATQRHGRGATVDGFVQVRPGRIASGRAWGDVSSSANAPADPTDGGAA